MAGHRMRHHATAIAALLCLQLLAAAADEASSRAQTCSNGDAVVEAEVETVAVAPPPCAGGTGIPRRMNFQRVPKTMDTLFLPEESFSHSSASSSASASASASFSSSSSSESSTSSSSSPTGWTAFTTEPPATPSSSSSPVQASPATPTSSSPPVQASPATPTSSSSPVQAADGDSPVDQREVLTANAIDEIVREHNLFRAQEGVPPLVWNATLAQYASAYAKQRRDCEMIHSTALPNGHHLYGENLIEVPGHKKWPWKRAVDEWTSEKKDYDYNANKCTDGTQNCHHYTAIVWKNTTDVGCGRAVCHSGDTMMVCNYWPTGNHRGQRPY